MSGKSQSNDATEFFVQQLTQHQNRLLGYIYSLLADESRAADVLQETNLVLWRRMDEFQPDRPFLPWAFAIARFQVLAHLRDQGRDRILLTEDLVELVSTEAEQQASQLDDSRLALQSCLEALPQDQRALISDRYFQRRSIAELAERFSRTAGAVKVALLRVRRQLASCVERKLATEGDA